MTSNLRRVARAAVPFGLATVDLHRILVGFALDALSPEFKAPLNHFGHARSLADPNDASIVAMNVDTPYSYAWLDLRTEPVVLTLPPFEDGRYLSAEVFDLYSYIVGYVSPRTNGTVGGSFLIHGPGWRGDPPPGMAVFGCPTDLGLVLVRTQLFDDDDLTAVVALQDRMAVQPLSSWLGQPAGPGPDTPPVPDLGTVDVRAPLGGDFLRVLGLMLGLMPVLAEDAHLRLELASIGVGGSGLAERLADPGQLTELTEGLAEGLADVRARCATVRSSAEIFGSREHFAGDHLSRAAGAVLGILGNAEEEYLGVGYPADAEGRPFDGAHRYRIRFAPDALPDVGAFWSITVYDGQQRLYANDLHRYVLGSRQLPQLARDPDGGITFVVQHEPPDLPLVANWLPCPAGPFGLAFRTYLPGPSIRNGSWTAPPVVRIDEEDLR